jgi:hypothetical protein
MAENYKGLGGKLLSNLPLKVPLKKRARSNAVQDEADQIARLEALHKLVEARNHAVEDLQQRISEEQRQNEWLGRQISEMTDFLEDYGLHWVGGPGPQFATFPHGPVDMGLFNQRISDLNNLADSIHKTLVEKKGVTAIQDPPKQRLVLFDKGFTINDGELRPYADPKNGIFIQDIIDGFFPGEFQKRFPNGIKLSVEDRRDSDIFRGPARRLIETARGLRAEKPKEEVEEELGKGDGRIKIRLPAGGELVVNTEKGTKIRQIRRFVQRNLEMSDFELCAPPSVAPLDDAATVDSLKLYPRGIMSVKFGMNSGPIRPVKL